MPVASAKIWLRRDLDRSEAFSVKQLSTRVPREVITRGVSPGRPDEGDFVRKTSLKITVVVGAAALVALSACSNSKKDTGGLGSGSSGSSGATSGGTYTIAFEGPLSGDNQQLGINEVNAAELAIDQANAKGDLGFTLKLLKADDVGDPSKAPAAAAQVLQDTTVMGVIGPSFSGATKAVGKTYGEAGLAFITPSASNGTLQTLGFKTFHRVIPNDNVEGTQGRRLAGHARA